MNVAALRRTFEIEIAAGTVIVYGKGVWDKAEIVQMTVPDNSELGTVVMHREIEKSAGGKTTSIPVELDSIKMDIEGAERNALMGAVSTLRRFKPALAIAGYHLADDPEAVAKAVKNSGVNYERGRCDCMFVFGRSSPTSGSCRTADSRCKFAFRRSRCGAGRSRRTPASGGALNTPSGTASRA